jgi:hypothetical protein
MIKKAPQNKKNAFRNTTRNGKKHSTDFKSNLKIVIRQSGIQKNKIMTPGQKYQ